MTELPDDIAQLKAMLLAKEEEVAALKTQVQLLIEQLNLSKSKRFSSQSEKVAKGTFNEAEQQNALPQPAAERGKTGRKPLPAECGSIAVASLSIIPWSFTIITQAARQRACASFSAIIKGICCRMATALTTHYRGCGMAHVRRKFTDAQKASPSTRAGKPEKALSFISKLYGIEKRAKGLSAIARQQLRQQESLPILNEFKAWLDNQHVLPKGALGKAISYTQNQWPKLLTYLDDGLISIDNNVTERDIRPFTTGRKNWMFSTSVGGAKASANLYSLVMTCRANDINPYYYFRHLFTELPKRSLADDMSDLMPWNVDLNGIE